MLLVAAQLARAHSGGTDANGCHAGSQPFHCHEPRAARRIQVVTRAVSSAPRPNELNVALRAVCVDGSVSYAATPAGACAHHGGVAAWFDGLDHTDRALVGRRGVEGPAHAAFADGRWACTPGYVAAAGACVSVRLPENARLHVNGVGWSCKLGFQRVGEACTPETVPEHAVLTPEGAGWGCLRGYARWGEVCRAVRVPENGRLTASGDGWVCEEGFAQAADGCVSR